MGGREAGQDVSEFLDVGSVMLTGWGRCVAVKTLPDSTDVELECIAVI